MIYEIKLLKNKRMGWLTYSGEWFDTREEAIEVGARYALDGYLVNISPVSEERIREAELSQRMLKPIVEVAKLKQ